MRTRRFAAVLVIAAVLVLCFAAVAQASTIRVILRGDPRAAEKCIMPAKIFVIDSHGRTSTCNYAGWWGGLTTSYDGQWSRKFFGVAPGVGTVTIYWYTFQGKYLGSSTQKFYTASPFSTLYFVSK